MQKGSEQTLDLGAEYNLDPVVVVFRADHDWDKETRDAAHASRRKLESAVVRSPMRIDGRLKDFDCYGGFGPNFDSRSGALRMADSQRSSQESGHQDMTVNVSFNPF